MSNITSALDSKEAYELIRTIYKFIPTYNQIKGTYLGIQFVLNTMGLCAKITELWRDRNDIDNFAKAGTLYREDEIGAVRRFAEDVNNNKSYRVTVQEVIEYPPKVSIRIDTFKSWFYQ